jgi:hypothetical protein
MRMILRALMSLTTMSSSTVAPGCPFRAGPCRPFRESMSVFSGQRARSLSLVAKIWTLVPKLINIDSPANRQNQSPPPEP